MARSKQQFKPGDIIVLDGALTPWADDLTTLVVLAKSGSGKDSTYTLYDLVHLATADVLIAQTKTAKIVEDLYILVGRSIFELIPDPSQELGFLKVNKPGSPWKK